MTNTTKYLLLIFAGAVIFFLGRGCKSSDPHPTPPVEKLKQSIATNKAKAEKLRPIIIIKDREVVKWRDRYHDRRHDSLIPCPEKLAIADTVIYQDSSLISSLKLLCKIDSNIIADQSKVISADSITIKGLKKEVRKQKVQKWLAVIGAVVIAGQAVKR